jgi:putative colanic acid biosysnthesis UDP-glucose lipid carrier transferase
MGSLMNAVVDPFSKGQADRSAREPVTMSSVAPRRAETLTGAYQITQPVFFKGNSSLAAFLLSLAAALPAAIASLTLYAVAQMYGVQFTESLALLLVSVTVLSILLLQSVRTPTAELLARRRTIVASLSIRWMMLLAALAALSYSSGFTAQYLSLYPLQMVVTWAIATPLILILATLLLHQVARAIVRQPKNRRTALFVGCNETSAALAERFAKHPELCLEVAGFFDDRNLERIGCATDMPLLGPLSQLPEFVHEHEVEVIFIALPLKHIPRVQKLLDALGNTTVSLYYVPDVLSSDVLDARAGEILGVPVIALRESPFHGIRGFLKRGLDIVVAGTAFVVALPVMLAIAAAIKLEGPGPVLFKQRRYGLDGREINIYKFRTMKVTEDGGWMAQAKRNDERVSKLGAFLRRWSLDELPQLYNVLQGRMSLVGPRPHAVAHNEEYRRLVRGYMIRHKVPPGLTGLAQIKGYRGATPRLQDMQARVHYDVQYVHHWSLWLDVKILLLTIPKLIRTDKAF